MVSFCSSPEITSRARVGSAAIESTRYWLGMPATARGTIFGGVRTASFCNASFGKVGRNLRTAVSRAHDEHTRGPEIFGVTVFARVDDAARETRQPGPVRHERSVVVARRDHDDRSSDRAAGGSARPYDGPLFCVTLHLDGRNSQSHIEAVRDRVVREIAKKVVATNPLALGCRNRRARERAEASRRVQVKSVIVPGPTRSDAISGIEHNHSESRAREFGGGCEPTGAGSDD